MLTHERIWDAVDALARRHGLSPSGLARRAGLDPTTFNRSKRIGGDGRPRWPSTESIAKVLAATGASIDEFMSLLSGRAPEKPEVVLPLLGFAEAGSGGYFDDGGFPSGTGWDEVRFPEVDGQQTYALEISGESMMPLYRDGDRIVVAPSEAVRPGDRVVVKTHGGEVLAKELKRRTGKIVELRSLNPEHPDRTLPAKDVAWIARIIWASQ